MSPGTTHPAVLVCPGLDHAHRGFEQKLFDAVCLVVSRDSHGDRRITGAATKIRDVRLGHWTTSESPTGNTRFS